MAWSGRELSKEEDFVRSKRDDSPPRSPAWQDVSREQTHLDDGVACFNFTVQAGVVILAFHGITIQAVTAVSNIVAKNREDNLGRKIAQYVLLYFFLSLMAFGYFSSFWAVYKYDLRWAYVGYFTLILGTILYLMLSVLSLVPSQSIRRAVCVDLRCPDYHWLGDAGWRHDPYLAVEGEDESDNTTLGALNSSTTETTSSEEKPYLTLLYVVPTVILSLILIGLYIYSICVSFAFIKYLTRKKKEYMENPANVDPWMT